MYCEVKRREDNIKLATRYTVSGMASNIFCYKQLPKFNHWSDLEMVYVRFVKYAKHFKDNHLKSYNIMDENHQGWLFLDFIGSRNESCKF